MNNFPKRIVCLTEESVETLFLLKKQHLIVGVSQFVKRPKEACELPKVSMFTSSNYEKINELRPDLILGHSDIQKDIARDLIGMGHNVYISNHRTINEIIEYIKFLSRLTSSEKECEKLLSQINDKLESAKSFAKTLEKPIKFYFEEWDEPAISAIEWVSEIIELCGGENIFKSTSDKKLAKERIINFDDVISLNPQFIFACWCGKKVKIDLIKKRKDWHKIKAVEQNNVIELMPEIFLQPGPAPIIDGIDQIISHFKSTRND